MKVVVKSTGCVSLCPMPRTVTTSTAEISLYEAAINRSKFARPREEKSDQTPESFTTPKTDRLEGVVKILRLLSRLEGGSLYARLEACRLSRTPASHDDDARVGDIRHVDGRLTSVAVRAIIFHTALLPAHPPERQRSCEWTRQSVQSERDRLEPARSVSEHVKNSLRRQSRKTMALTKRSIISRVTRYNYVQSCQNVCRTTV